MYIYYTTIYYYTIIYIILFKALGILNFKERYEQIIYAFTVRLLDNEYTAAFIKSLATTSTNRLPYNSLVKKILKQHPGMTNWKTISENSFIRSAQIKCGKPKNLDDTEINLVNELLLNYPSNKTMLNCLLNPILVNA